jgi:hypothetical protein
MIGALGAGDRRLQKAVLAFAAAAMINSGSVWAQHRWLVLTRIGGRRAFALHLALVARGRCRGRAPAEGLQSPAARLAAAAGLGPRPGSPRAVGRRPPPGRALPSGQRGLLHKLSTAPGGDQLTVVQDGYEGWAASRRLTARGEAARDGLVEHQGTWRGP